MIPLTTLDEAVAAPHVSARPPATGRVPARPRNYRLLLAGQFLSAFGDNCLLAAMLSPLTFQLLAGTITEQQVGQQNALFSAAFFLPFILLAPIAGHLNDQQPKTRWLLGGNLLKLLGVLVVVAGVSVASAEVLPAWIWPVIGYGIVGLGACLYSPAKYGILPEILPPNRLVKANGTVELLTLVAILGGLWAGAAIYDQTGSLLLCYAACLAVYLAAATCSALMDRTARQAARSWRASFTSFGAAFTTLWRNPRLGRVLLGCGIFWFAGAVLRGNLQGWGVETLMAAGWTTVTNQTLALLKIGLIVGIVTGSVLAGRLHRIGDLSWSRRYGIAMALGILVLGLVGGSSGLSVAISTLVATGVAAGLLLVPLNAALQHEADPTSRGRTIAIQNLVDYGAMLVGAGFLHFANQFGFSPGGTFVALAVVLVMLALALRFNRSAA